MITLGAPLKEILRRCIVRSPFTAVCPVHLTKEKLAQHLPKSSLRPLRHHLIQGCLSYYEVNSVTDVRPYSQSILIIANLAHFVQTIDLVCRLFDLSRRKSAGTDKAKTTRKRLKPGKNKHRNGRARKKPGGSYQKGITRGHERKHKGNGFLLLSYSQKYHRCHITDCHIGNPCELRFDPTAYNAHPMIERNEERIEGLEASHSGYKKPHSLTGRSN
ncbi:hypothetical protein Tco_0281693 [Tanacetum coccineum]